MTSQEQHVLDEFYKNAVMGADATSTILPKADHPDLRQELCKQLEFYQSRKEEIRSQMCSQSSKATWQSSGQMPIFSCTVWAGLLPTRSPS